MSAIAHSRRSSTGGLDFTAHANNGAEHVEAEFDELSYEEIEIEDWESDANSIKSSSNRSSRSTNNINNSSDEDYEEFYEEFEVYDEDDDTATYVTIEEEDAFGALFTIYEVDNEDTFDEDTDNDNASDNAQQQLTEGDSSSHRMGTPPSSEHSNTHANSGSLSKLAETMSPTSVVPIASVLPTPPAPLAPPCHAPENIDATPKAMNQRKRRQSTSSVSMSNSWRSGDDAGALSSQPARSKGRSAQRRSSSHRMRRQSLDSSVQISFAGDSATMLNNNNANDRMDPQDSFPRRSSLSSRRRSLSASLDPNAYMDLHPQALPSVCQGGPEQRRRSSSSARFMRRASMDGHVGTNGAIQRAAMAFS
uniref:Uncharacterized protein n=1 Tax=Craspedostauros australis TaxID=1486917 RepID=A0A7R9WPJ8_9STRA|eukprot:CAMPEP_0198115162 /NCGR_PEP_ID=MMETSP1442-20131203/6344_1 /TAXON_ID= /ORGANISM="Craspedostauros australis, Strain CCMP3328" /LENGTH=363 /DNA_ID=CAMNT_0043772617 /DNA_START=43 /DNA_END=1134 /DNA_ORIENTATION=+